MAHPLLRDNAQHLRIRAQRRFAILVMIAGPAGIVALAVYSQPLQHGILIAALFLSTLIAKIVLNRTRRIAAGIHGETIALHAALKLPASFALFNNVLVPAMNGYHPRELDLVAVGPDCVFVIEVKHFKGKIIRGKGKWSLRKIGRGGTVYYSEVSNPIRQVSSAAVALAHYLKSRHVQAWVQGATCFTQKRPSFFRKEIQGVLVTHPRSLCRRLTSWTVPKYAEPCHYQPAMVIDAIQRLAEPEAVAAILKLRPELR